MLSTEKMRVYQRERRGRLKTAEEAAFALWLEGIEERLEVLESVVKIKDGDRVAPEGR